MEKVDKAIALAVDNAARIESTARLLRAHIDGEKKTALAVEKAARSENAEADANVMANISNVKVLSGQACGDRTTLGVAGANGGVIVRFCGADARLCLNGNVIAAGASPLIASTDGGGLLELLGVRDAAVAIVIGGEST